MDGRVADWQLVVGWGMRTAGSPPCGAVGDASQPRARLRSGGRSRPFPTPPSTPLSRRGPGRAGRAWGASRAGHDEQAPPLIENGGVTAGPVLVREGDGFRPPFSGSPVDS